MIQPLNNHVLIEPLKHETFISSDKGTYEEMGVVIALPVQNNGEKYDESAVRIGDKVYFDSWLCAKYPKNDKEWYWLVRWEDIRAFERKDV